MADAGFDRGRGAAGGRGARHCSSGCRVRVGRHSAGRGGDCAGSIGGFGFAAVEFGGVGGFLRIVRRTSGGRGSGGLSGRGAGFAFHFVRHPGLRSSGGDGLRAARGAGGGLPGAGLRTDDGGHSRGRGGANNADDFHLSIGRARADGGSGRGRIRAGCSAAVGGFAGCGNAWRVLRRGADFGGFAAAGAGRRGFGGVSGFAAGGRGAGVCVRRRRAAFAAADSGRRGRSAFATARHRAGGAGIQRAGGGDSSHRPGAKRESPHRSGLHFASGRIFRVGAGGSNAAGGSGRPGSICGRGRRGVRRGFAGDFDGGARKRLHSAGGFGDDCGHRSADAGSGFNFAGRGGGRGAKRGGFARLCRGQSGIRRGGFFGDCRPAGDCGVRGRQGAGGGGGFGRRGFIQGARASGRVGGEFFRGRGGVSADRGGSLCRFHAVRPVGGCFRGPRLRRGDAYRHAGGRRPGGRAVRHPYLGGECARRGADGRAGRRQRGGAVYSGPGGRWIVRAGKRRRLRAADFGDSFPPRAGCAAACDSSAGGGFCAVGFCCCAALAERAGFGGRQLLPSGGLPVRIRIGRTGGYCGRPRRSRGKLCGVQRRDCGRFHAAADRQLHHNRKNNASRIPGVADGGNCRGHRAVRGHSG